MRFLRILAVLTIVFSGLSAVSVNAQSFDGNNAAQQVIGKKIYKEIVTLPYYGLFDNIAYKIEGSTVTLSGKVVRPTTKSDAANVVKRIAGVSNVVNNIEVLPLSSFDDQIRYQVANTLANQGGSLYRYLQGTNPSLKIIVEHGNVSLEGYVATRGDYNRAGIITKTVPGTFSVNNNLIIEREQSR